MKTLWLLLPLSASACTSIAEVSQPICHGGITYDNWHALYCSSPEAVLDDWSFGACASTRRLSNHTGEMDGAHSNATYSYSYGAHGSGDAHGDDDHGGGDNGFTQMLDAERWRQRQRRWRRRRQQQQQRRRRLLTADC